jgi:hypothetical protein
MPLWLPAYPANKLTILVIYDGIHQAIGGCHIARDLLDCQYLASISKISRSVTAAGSKHGLQARV